MVLESKADVHKQKHFFGQKLVDQKRGISLRVVVMEESIHRFVNVAVHPCNIPSLQLVPLELTQIVLSPHH